LTLCLAAQARRRQWKLEALRRLRDARCAEAIAAARQCAAVKPGEDAARLIAVAQLLAGRFAAALETYDSISAPG
jgi:hypothetical protein